MTSELNGSGTLSVLANARPSALLAGKQFESTAAGVTGGFGILRYKGKVWSLSYKGKNYPFMRTDGSGPLNAIDVVIVRSADHKSKTFYPGGYVEGSREKPVCWSHDGIKPDMDVQSKQHSNCPACPQNQVGSRVNTATGKKSRACQDHKIVAVVVDPTVVGLLQDALGQPANLELAEPVLLRIPAASLTDYGAYGELMLKQKFQVINLVTRVSFDHTVPYPKFKLEPVRVLTDDEVAIALELREDPLAVRIVGPEAVADDTTYVPVAQGSAPTGAPVHTKPALTLVQPMAVAPVAAGVPLAGVPLAVAAITATGQVAPVAETTLPWVDPDEAGGNAELDAQVKALLGE